MTEGTLFSNRSHSDLLRRRPAYLKSGARSRCLQVPRLWASRWCRSTCHFGLFVHVGCTAESHCDRALFKMTVNSKLRGYHICRMQVVSSKHLWPTRFDISMRQYARIVHGWVLSIGLKLTAYGAHSMRRTNVTQIYRKTGNLRAVQFLLGHIKMHSMVRYLGVDLEDTVAVSCAIES